MSSKHTPYSILRTIVLGSLFLPGTLGIAMEVTGLRCEYAVDPLGIDIERPRLFWRLEDEHRGVSQRAYQVLVSDSIDSIEADHGNLWDSGRVETDRTIQVLYDGRELESGMQVYWKVRVWDNHDQLTEWSAPATWTMGIMSAGEWEADWIQSPQEYPSLLFRKPFVVKESLNRAIAFVSGLGQYEMYLNGEKSGNDFLSPGWTRYDKTTLYDTRDITSLLQPGRNVVGLILGNGMYHVRREGRFSKFEGSFGDKRAIVQIRLEYEDGSVHIVKSDGSWKSHSGPITYSNIYGGEDHDARLEPAGWSQCGLDDAGWTEVVVDDSLPKDTLRGFSASANPIVPIEVREPVSIRALDGPGAFLYDFGQNASYIPRLTVRGPVGSVVRLIPGENIFPDGYISRASMGGIHRNTSWWEYTLSSYGPETWTPRFFYIGSRYIQSQTIAAEPGAERPVVESLQGVIVHSSASPVGAFETSNPLMNKIRALVRWAQRSNMVSVLTDCPHREKLGWLEQYHLNGPAIRYEFDMNRIFTKGMLDMADAQMADGMVPNIAPEYTVFRGPFRSTAEWGAAFIVVPWQQYLFSGDIRLIREYYPAMKRYFDYLESTADNYLLPEGLGDWFDLGPRRPPGRSQLTLPPLTTTAFFYNDAILMSRMAKLLGNNEDADYFENISQKIRDRFNQTFYDPEGGFYGTNSQCANALALVMGIAEEQNRSRVLANLVQDVVDRGYTMTAGDIGFRYLLLALSEGDCNEVIYKMINQDDQPGYGYQIRMGATALTEAWDGNTVTSNNHFMLGHITEWFYGYLLGIRPDPDHPGFKHILLEPNPVGDLEWVKGSYESIHGTISAEWSRQGDLLRYSVVIPPNTTAVLKLPVGEATDIAQSVRILGSESGVRILGKSGSKAVLGLQSGSYAFAVRNVEEQGE